MSIEDIFIDTAFEDEINNSSNESINAKSVITIIESESAKSFKKAKFNLFKYAGTVYSLKQSIEFVDPGIEYDSLTEWFQDPINLNPYEFNVSLVIQNSAITPDLINNLRNAIYEFKNVRSHLKEIELAYSSSGTVYINCITVGEVGSYCKMRS